MKAFAKLLKTHLHKILIILSLIVIGELLWAVNFFISFNKYTKEINSKKYLSISSNPEATQSASIKLNPTAKELKVGEVFTVELYVDTGEIKTDGTDVILNYDTNLLSLVPSSGSKPIKEGTIYSTYPLNQHDIKNGLIKISGIADDKPVSVVGVLATMTFKALKPGEAKINLQYKPGSTIDSNIVSAETSKDILTLVQNGTFSIR